MIICHWAILHYNMSFQIIAGRSDGVFWWFPALSEDQEKFVEFTKLSCGFKTMSKHELKFTAHHVNVSNTFHNCSFTSFEKQMQRKLCWIKCTDRAGSGVEALSWWKTSLQPFDLGKVHLNDTVVIFDPQALSQLKLNWTPYHKGLGTFTAMLHYFRETTSSTLKTGTN